jgi:hypothetical protein
MRNRTLGVILTILVIFLLGLPGVAFMCSGLTFFIIELGVPLNLTQGWSTALNLLSISGLCVGFLLVLITIIASYFLLHQKVKTPPVKPTEPLPPTVSDKATPLPGSNEVLPPTRTDEPIPPPSSDEPLPPTT